MDLCGRWYICLALSIFRYYEVKLSGWHAIVCTTVHKGPCIYRCFNRGPISSVLILQQTLCILTINWNIYLVICVIIGTHQRKISCILMLPIHCSPGGTDVVKLDTYCISCNERPLKPDVYCMFPILNWSKHRSSILSRKVYVSELLDLYYNWWMQARNVQTLYYMISTWCRVWSCELLPNVELTLFYYL